jgi:hypothetical protein
VAQAWNHVEPNASMIIEYNRNYTEMTVGSNAHERARAISSRSSVRGLQCIGVERALRLGEEGD